MPFGAIKSRFRGRAANVVLVWNLQSESTRILALRQCLTANNELSKTRRSISIPARIILYTRRKELIDVQRSSIRHSRGRRGGYQASVDTLTCKGLRLRANQLLQLRGFNDPARNRPAWLWLRSCMPSHPRLVRRPHRSSTNRNSPQPPSSEYARLLCNPALPRCPRACGTVRLVHDGIQAGVHACSGVRLVDL